MNASVVTRRAWPRPRNSLILAAVGANLALVAALAGVPGSGIALLALVLVGPLLVAGVTAVELPRDGVVLLRVPQAG